MRHSHRSLDHTESTPLFRPPRPDVPPPESRPKTWTFGHFPNLFSITVTRYRVTGVHVRSEPCFLSFDHDLLRFALGLTRNDHNAIHIDYSSIKHVDIQEVPRKEPKPNEIMGYPHLRENETECFGGNASLIKVQEGHKLAEIRYGNAFELSVLYLSAAPSDLDSLKDLISSLNGDENVSKFATHVRYNRWVHRKMVEAVGNAKDFQFREFKLILSDFLNINLPEKYRDWWQEFSSSNAGTMNLQKLQEFFHAFMLETYLLGKIILEGYTYTKNGLSIDQFNKFCKKVQKQDISADKRKFVLGKRVSGRKVSKKESKVPIKDFCSMLFSRENDIFAFDKKRTDEADGDMSYPLNNYWINSSHNTYLMGHQITGVSSVEAYIRTLLQGCRCLELDCIDGPNNEPIVWHQNTLCTKIKLLDVLKAINRFAFVTSDYPIILSIENHLCIDQQIVMASMMTHIFKSKLVSYDLFPQDPYLPSPDALKRKILIKNKKIQENLMDEDEDADEPDENDEEFQNDTGYSTIQQIQADSESRELKTFSVYFNDDIDGELYSYCQIALQGSFLYVKEERDRLSQRTEMRLHACNSWYFGSISRATSEEVVKDFILSRYLNRGIDQNEAIGSFLVRRSGTPLTGLYNIVVTVWVGNAVKHVKVKSEINEQTGRPEFYLNSSHEKFDTVPKFINFYHVRDDIPQSAFFRYPIPNTDHFINKLWYKGDMDRQNAESLLLTPPIMTGKFLIRDRIVKNTKVGFTVSFLQPRDFHDATKGHIVQHLTAQEVGPFVRINENLKFWSLNHLVEHFTKNPITNEGAVKLTMICKDGAHSVSNGALADRLTIELNEAYPYEDPAQKLKIMLLKGFKLHNAVRTREDGKDFYTADLGTRLGLKIPEEIATVVKDETPFGNLLKTKILIEKQPPIMSTKSDLFGFSTPISRITMKFSSNKEVHLFAKLFTEAATHASGGGHDAAKKGLSKELSDLVIYCQAVKVPKPFAPAKISLMEPYQMCSFTELTIDKFAKNRVDYMNLGRFCHKQLGRMYPNWKRIDSSNYNPMLPWAYGMQLVALNFQTPDLAMQLNHGMFARNQHKGYILKPQFIQKEQYDPNNLKTYVTYSDPEEITIKILTGRLISLPKHWNKTGCFVSVHLHGIGPEQTVVRKSTVDKKPGISPKWYQDIASNTMKFKVGFPQLAMIQFALYSSSNELLGQRCVPVDYIREGYRSVILHNMFGEELELAALLVHVEKQPWEAYESCDRQDQNNQRESELQKKATDLASVIHSSITYRNASVESLAEQQRLLESHLTELFDLKYSDKFIDALMNPMGATSAFSNLL